MSEKKYSKDHEWVFLIPEAEGPMLNILQDAV